MSKLTPFAIIALGVCAASVASAETYSTGFEAPQFTLGQSIDGQQGWFTQYAPAASVIGNNGDGSAQDLDVNGALSVLDPNSLQDSSSYAPLGTNFSMRASASVDIWQTGPMLQHFADGQNDLASSNFSVGIGSFTGQCWVSDDGYFYVLDYDAGIGYYKSYALPNPTGYNAVGISIAISGAQALVTYSLGGSVVDSLTMTPNQSYGSDYSGLGFLAVPSFGSFNYGDYASHFDNYVWNSSVPEPATALPLALGLIGLARRRKRGSRL